MMEFQPARWEGKLPGPPGHHPSAKSQRFGVEAMDAWRRGSRGFINFLEDNAPGFAIAIVAATVAWNLLCSRLILQLKPLKPAEKKRRKKTKRGSRGSGNALWGSMGCCAVVLVWDGQLLPTKSMPCHAAQLVQSTRFQPLQLSTLKLNAPNKVFCRTPKNAWT